MLGIDPGSRITGFGIIDVQGQKNAHVHSGCIRTSKDGDFPIRLKEIFIEVSALVKEYQPQELAIEKVFMNKNADSALKLGQARGSAMVAAMQSDLEVYEYSPNRIKQSIVGRGHADKTQVQHMIKMLLMLPEPPQEDQADALAVAVCHAHSRQSAILMRSSA
ncbi:MAG: crossover junction endodeoxyribonuclease RuvC [Gammaproteobacteria bacterium]